MDLSADGGNHDGAATEASRPPREPAVRPSGAIRIVAGLAERPALSCLPKGRFGTDYQDVVEKARAMVRRGKSDLYISDYLGMVLDQVRSIRRTTRPEEPGRARQAPTSLTPAAIENADAQESLAAELDSIQGCQLLAEAIDRLLGKRT